MTPLTLDFETYYSQDYSLSKLSTELYIRDRNFQVIGVGVKDGNADAVWMNNRNAGELRDYLWSLDIKNRYLLAHNTAFDGSILAWHFGIRPQYYLDTLGMARPVTGATVGGSLAKLAKKFNLGEKGTEVVQAKNKRLEDFTDAELAQYGEYCKNDCVLTHLLWNILQQYSTPKELFVIDLLLRMYIDPVLELDSSMLATHLSTVQLKKKELMDRVDASIGGRAELMSNPKLAQVLQMLGVDPPMKTSKQTNQLTYAFAKTDEGFTALMNHEDVRVQTVVAARLGIRSTLEETRTQAFIGMALRGRMPVPIGYYNAHTGRSGGMDGINLQNLPRGGSLRRSLLAPPGHRLVAGDSAQIEARIVAWLAGQADLVADFAAGVDIYSNFASELYERPVNRKLVEIDAATNKPFNPDKLEGFVGKTCILGLGFGMGDERLQNTLRIGQGGISVDMPLDRCSSFVKHYRTKYSKIEDLWGVAQDAMVAVSRGFTTTFGDVLPLTWDQDGIHLPNGMMIRYANLRRNEDKEYVYDGRYGPVKLFGGKIIENVVQALARIVVFDQMCRIEQNLRKHDNKVLGKRFRVVLTVHDEVVACVPTQMEVRTREMMERVMAMVPKWAVGLPIACEIGSGPNYADCK